MNTGSEVAADTTGDDTTEPAATPAATPAASPAATPSDAEIPEMQGEAPQNWQEQQPGQVGQPLRPSG